MGIVLRLSYRPRSHAEAIASPRIVPETSTGSASRGKDRTARLNCPWAAYKNQKQVGMNFHPPGWLLLLPNKGGADYSTNSPFPFLKEAPITPRIFRCRVGGPCILPLKEALITSRIPSSPLKEAHKGSCIFRCGRPERRRGTEGRRRTRLPEICGETCYRQMQRLKGC